MQDIKEDLIYLKATTENQLPDWADRATLIRFFNETMKPWHDQPEDVERGLEYAFSDAQGEGGFVLLARQDSKLAGALLMLHTGMQGYIPENLLLFVSVAPELRGQGLGSRIIERAIDECEGSIKLHVEYENPAKRLYERLGFTNKYAEMRLSR